MDKLPEEKQVDELVNGWYDDYTAAHEMRPTLTTDEQELLVTRKKLEVRTWLLRVSTGLLVATWGGLILREILSR
jgi:hypothetical protein